MLINLLHGAADATPHTEPPTPATEPPKPPTPAPLAPPGLSAACALAPLAPPGLSAAPPVPLDGVTEPCLRTHRLALEAPACCSPASLRVQTSMRHWRLCLNSRQRTIRSRLQASKTRTPGTFMIIASSPLHTRTKAVSSPFSVETTRRLTVEIQTNAERSWRALTKTTMASLMLLSL